MDKSSITELGKKVGPRLRERRRLATAVEVSDSEWRRVIEKWPGIGAGWPAHFAGHVGEERRGKRVPAGGDGH